MWGKVYQAHTAFACSFGVLLNALVFVWPSYTLDLYKAENSTLLSSSITNLECSLMGSLPPLGAMLGSAVCGVVIDRIGRQKGGIVLLLPFVLSWSMIKLSSSTTTILIARFFGGVSGGALFVFAPIFISEVAEDSIRGALASGPVTMYCLGCLVSYILGWFTSYHFTLWMNLAFSITGVILLLTVVESPLYLMRQNRVDEARASLAHYRGATVSSKCVLEDLSRLKQKVMPPVELTIVTDKAETEKLNHENGSSNNAPKVSGFKLLLASPSSRRAFMVVGTHLTLQVFMGIVPVQIYAKILFMKAAPDLSSHMCSVILAMVMLTGSIFTVLIADKGGRRILIITSSILVALSMIILGILITTNIAPPLLSAVVLLVYCFAFNVGSGTVPYVLLAESFIPEVQNIASMLLIELVWFLNFILIAVFPYILRLLGFHIVCFIFAGTAVGNAVAAFVILPETKGLSNEQIQEALLRRRK